MAKLKVFDRQGKEKTSLDLPEEIFAARVKPDIIHQAVVMYQAARRQGTASTKERSEVSGGGAKPYRQKGTGRARAGSSRSPLWRGGGVTFGPRPREYRYTIPQKIRQAALRESVKAKFQDGQLVCVEDLTEPFSKTKDFAGLLKALSLRGKILALLDGSDGSVRRVTRNIPRLETKPSSDVNAFDVVNHRLLLVTQTGIQRLCDRFAVSGDKK